MLRRCRIISNKSPKIRDEPLPPKISQLISFGRDLPLRLADVSLDTNEVAILKQIVKRTVRPLQDFNMSSAVRLLAQSEKSSEVCRILGELIGNKNESTTNRVVAAIGLSYIEGPEAQNALIKNLGVDNPFVKQEVIKSLGIFGDEKALEELHRLSEQNFEFVSTYLTLAETLIIHRLGLTAEVPELRLRVERKKPPQDDKLINLAIQDMQREETNSDEESLLGTRYGIKIGKKGFRIQAGEARWTLFVNSDMISGKEFDKLFKRKWIAALLALWDRRTNTLSVQFIVLTNPDNDPEKKSIDLIVVRTDGLVLCAEHVTDINSILAFPIGKRLSAVKPVTF